MGDPQKGSRKNAHPQKDCFGSLIVVHNGIIENYLRLKRELLKKAHRFSSETDTEVFAHLVEEEIKAGKSFKDAVRSSFNKIQGLNAVVVLSKDGEVAAFRRGPPLVVGKDGEQNFYLSSDIPSLASLTEQMILIEENEGVLLNKSGIKMISLGTGRERESRFSTISMEFSEVEKGRFPHYMLKEIFEEPEVVARIVGNGKEILQEIARMVKEAWGTFLTACGTASYSGIAATYMFSEIAKRHVNFIVGSEFPYF